MTSRASRLAVAVVALAAVWLAWDVWNSDARRIERRFAKLCKLAEKSAVEKPIEGAARARKMAELFAGRFQVTAESENFATSNRQDLIRGILSYRMRSNRITVDVVREEVVMVAGKAKGTLYAYVRLVADWRDMAGGDTHPVRIEWSKDGGDWKIERLEILPPESAS